MHGHHGVYTAVKCWNSYMMCCSVAVIAMLYINVIHQLSVIGTCNQLLMEQIWQIFKRTRSFVQNGP